MRVCLHAFIYICMSLYALLHSNVYMNVVGLYVYACVVRLVSVSVYARAGAQGKGRRSSSSDEEQQECSQK
jgi:hypothetical protein